MSTNIEDLVQATIAIAKVTEAIDRLALHATHHGAANDVSTVRRFMKPHIDAEIARIRESTTAMKTALLGQEHQ